MTRADQTERSGRDEECALAGDLPPRRSVREYRAPRLAYLGTVLELTLTGTGSASEGVIPKPGGG